MSFISLYLLVWLGFLNVKGMQRKKTLLVWGGLVVIVVGVFFGEMWWLEPALSPLSSAGQGRKI